MNPLTADAAFFTALIKGDTQSLARLLTDDFILIEVMGGSEISKSELLAAIDSKQVEFRTIEPAEQRVRFFGKIAIITGRTQMSGCVGHAPFALSSRYTHVYVADRDEWRLATAQGTQISFTR